MHLSTHSVIRATIRPAGLLIAGTLIGGCESKNPGPPPPATTTAAAPAAASLAPTLDDLKNATYTGFKGPQTPVTLKEGRWESANDHQSIAFVGDMMATGDLNGDGSADAAAALGENTGGSGEQLYLAVVSKAGNGVKNIATTAIGPNVKLRKMQIADRSIRLDVLQVSGDDPMCCPSDLATRTFTLQDQALQEQPVVHTGKLTPDAMAGTEWVLRRLSSDEPAPANPKITLRFESGKFVGSSGCNRYTAAVEPGDLAGAIHVSQSVSTRMACPEPAMSLESKFLKVLGEVTHFTFYGGQLALMYQTESAINSLFFDPAEHE